MTDDIGDQSAKQGPEAPGLLGGSRDVGNRVLIDGKHALFK